MNFLNRISLYSNNLEESLYFYTHILDFSLDEQEDNSIFLSNKNNNIILDSNKNKNSINIFIKEKDFHYFKEKMKRYKIKIEQNLSLIDPSENEIFIKLI